MSTESSLDPQLIEQTKQQIRSLVAEIAQLSKEDVAPEEFYGQFLTRVVSALAAVGGAVWTVNDEGRLALQYQINIQETKLRENEEGQVQHSRLLYKALKTAEGLLVPPHSGSGEDDQAANPTDFLLVLGPLKTDLETVGVLEVFQRSEAGINTQKGYLRFLLQMCELAADFLKSHQLRHFSDRQVLWTQLEEFTHTVHGGLDPRETAYTIANEGRRLIECDRVSVAIRKGSKCKIEAVSGQDLFDKRSNTVRLLGKLATAVVATGDPIWYAGDTRDMPPQVEDAVQEYIDESHSKNVAVLPLKRPQAAEEDDPNKREAPEAPIGALIVEQIEDSRVPQSMVQRVDVVCRHSSTALANSLEHQNLFLMPVWRTLGKAKWVLRARTLPKTLAITGVILAALAALVFWPADFEVQAKGTLEPVTRHDVFARVEGVVDDVLVEHGHMVYTTETGSAVEAAVGRLGTGGAVVVDEALLAALSEELSAAGIDAKTAQNITGAVERLGAQHGGQQIPIQDVMAAVRQEMKVLLIKLRSYELKVAIEDVRGRLETTRTQIIEARRTKADEKDRMKRDEIAGRIAALEQQERSLVEQLNLYRIKESELQVTSPINGLVVTWDLYNRLNHRPVQRGQVLLRVADPWGDWQVELQMPEDRMGFIHAAQQDLYQELREKLREVMQQKQPDLTAEDLDTQVTGVPDTQLVATLRGLLAEELLADLHGKVRTILGQPAEELPEDVSGEPEAAGDDSLGAAALPAEDGPAAPPTVDPVDPAAGEPVEGETLEETTEVVEEEPVEEVLDPAVRAALEDVLATTVYEAARAKLATLLDQIPRSELHNQVVEALDDGLDDRLPVTYIMATDPSDKLQGKVQEIHLNAEVQGEEGNTVLMKVAIDKQQLLHLRPGATVTANVYCGRRSIGFVWFHDLIAFIQSRILFRYF